jgi:hypothetical protein
MQERQCNSAGEQFEAYLAPTWLLGHEYPVTLTLSLAPL